MYGFRGYSIRVYPGNYTVANHPIAFSAEDMSLRGILLEENITVPSVIVKCAVDPCIDIDARDRIDLTNGYEYRYYAPKLIENLEFRGTVNHGRGLIAANIAKHLVDTAGRYGCCKIPLTLCLFWISWGCRALARDFVSHTCDERQV